MTVLGALAVRVLEALVVPTLVLGPLVAWRGGGPLVAGTPPRLTTAVVVVVTPTQYGAWGRLGCPPLGSERGSEEKPQPVTGKGGGTRGGRGCRAPQVMGHASPRRRGSTDGGHTDARRPGVANTYTLEPLKRLPGGGGNADGPRRPANTGRAGAGVTTCPPSTPTVYAGWVGGGSECRRPPTTHIRGPRGGRCGSAARLEGRRVEDPAWRGRLMVPP